MNMKFNEDGYLCPRIDGLGNYCCDGTMELMLLSDEKPSEVEK